MLMWLMLSAGLTAALVTYSAFALKRAPAAIRLERYAHMPGEAASGPAWQETWQIAFVRPLAPVIERLLPGHYLDQLKGRLRMAGLYGAAPFQVYLGSTVLLALGLAMLGAMFGGRLAFVYAAAGLGFGFVLPSFWLGAQVKKRQAAIDSVLSDSVDLLTACVEAGLGLDAAIGQLVRRKSENFAAINQELNRYLQELQIGLARPEALRNLGTRCGVEDLKQVVTALLHGDALGVGVSQILRAQTTHLRMRRKQRAEEKAMKAPIKILFPLLFGIFPSIFVLILGPAGIQLMDAFVGKFQ